MSWSLTPTPNIPPLYQRGVLKRLSGLIDTPAHISDPELRSRLRLLISLLLFTLFAGALTLIFEGIGNPASTDDADYLTVLTISIIIIPLYLRAKQGFVTLPVLVLIALLFALCTIGSFTANSLPGLPYFIVIPIFLTSIFFSSRFVPVIALLAVITSTVFYATLLTNQSYELQRRLIETNLFTLTSSGFLWVYINHRRVIERYRRQELVEAYDYVKTAGEEMEKRVVERTRELDKSREDLQASERRYRQLVENTRDTLFTTNVRGKFTYISPSTIELTGYSEQQLLSMRFNDVVAPDSRHRVARFYIEQSRTKAQDTLLEFPIITAGGQTRWVEQKLSALQDDQNQLIGFQAIVRDIGDRKLNEERTQAFLADLHALQEILQRQNVELVEARKAAESANTHKSRYLATMSHELRTPLSAIIGYTQILMFGMAGDVTNEQVKYCDRILVNTNHLLELINGVLDLSKIESGEVELKLETFNLRGCIDEVIAQNIVLVENKGLTLNIILADNLPDAIRNDRGRLKQIIINLISNAVKFTDHGAITLQARGGGVENWEFSVTDTGIGIPPDQQENVFAEFKQTLSGELRGGTGLGLAIVRQLVLLMGGAITLESELDKGTTFTVSLPITHHN